MDYSLFLKFAPVLTDPMPPKVRDPRLLIDEEGGTNVYYAPFEYINPEARIVLVGITPGPTQMINANNEARSALRQNLAAEQVMKRAKLTASFSGEPMRSNLTKQINHWGIPQWLGIDDAASMFGKHANLVQSTSLLRFPTFVDGNDYAGVPDMRRHPLLKKYLYEFFVEEVRQLPNAIFFGLGPKVHKVLAQLVRDGTIQANQVASGMLHPSGNNTYRISYLTSDRSGPIPYATNPKPYDAGRTIFHASFLKMRSQS